MREEGATNGERIYIPQHPQAWGKRIAVGSSDTHDTGGFARVYSLNEPRCGGSGNDVGYYADTQGGFSGSPVLKKNYGPNSILIYPTTTNHGQIITIAIRSKNECGYSNWKYQDFTVYSATSDGGIGVMH